MADVALLNSYLKDESSGEGAAKRRSIALETHFSMVLTTVSTAALSLLRIQLSSGALSTNTESCRTSEHTERQGGTSRRWG